MIEGDKHYSRATEAEIAAYRSHVEKLQNSPIPSSEILANLALFLNRSSLSRILFLDHLYRRILRTPGSVFEFGVRWGRDLAVLTTLRAIYEPHNFSRKVVGFDTFEGFPGVAEEDGSHEVIRVGSLAVSSAYEEFLAGLLSTHEQLAPRPQLKKFDLIKGDVTNTFPEYLHAHPETVIALAYFDMDLYSPTLNVLNQMQNHVTKGTVVAFDEVNYDVFPGETSAIRDCRWIRECRLQRLRIMGFECFMVIE